MIRRGVRDYFRLRPEGARIGAEVDEEIAFHIEQRVRHLVALGYSPEGARAEAERRFGRLAHARLTLQRSAHRREYRMSIREWFNDWRKDFAYTARSLAREPLVSIVVVITLALGIGANATMFGIIDRTLLRGPLHITNAHDVKRLYFTQEGFFGDRTTSRTGYVVYTTMRDKTRSFDGVAIYGEIKARAGTGEDSREIPTERASWDMFPLLGVKPVLGRFYNADEDKPPKGADVAVISYDTWRKDYGGLNSVLGKTIEFSNKKYTIIGVAPKGFTGPALEPVAVWIPFSADEDPANDWATSWCCTGPKVIARLKAGVTAEAAASEATRAYRAAALEAKAERAVKGTITAQPIGFGEDGRETAESSVTRWLGGVSLIVLIVACANVINLLLARGVRRRREVSIRLAMGISRSRLARLLLSEGLILAFAGGLAAMLIAYWGGTFIRATLLPEILWGPVIDLRVLAFSAAVALTVGVIIGFAPALESARHDLSSTLRATTRQGGGQRRSTLRDSLTVLQAAMSLVLLVGAGLFVRSLIRIDHLNLGIQPDRVVTVWPVLAPDPKDDSYGAMQEREDRLNKEALARFRSRADVENAALALGTPLGSSFGVSLKIPGFDSVPHQAGGGPFISAVSPSYFATVGTKLKRGRLFNENEGKGTARVAIINERMANTLWPGGDALTKCLIISDLTAPCTPIVGIVEDVHRQGLREEPSFQYYIPFGQEVGIGGMQLLVRPRGDAAAFMPTARKELFALAPDARYFLIDVLSKRLDPQIRPWRLGATLFIAFGLLALVISGLGLFSVIAYAVTQRRAEIGIRLALGARASRIVGLILQQGIRLAVVGILLGILLVLAGSRFIEPLLFDTSARDAVTIAGVAAILLATTILACTLPAMRARRVDPVEALRAE
jgi:predicted permease